MSYVNQDKCDMCSPANVAGGAKYFAYFCPKLLHFLIFYANLDSHHTFSGIGCNIRCQKTSPNANDIAIIMKVEVIENE